jgi:hypothetical protein
MKDAKPLLIALPTAGLANLGRLAIVVFLAAGLAVGCHKNNQEVVAVDEGIVPSDPQVAANLANLSGALRRAMHQHRLTDNFDEFVAVANVDVPSPPPGLKYAINKRWKVILVDANAK